MAFVEPMQHDISNIAYSLAFISVIQYWYIHKYFISISHFLELDGFDNFENFPYKEMNSNSSIKIII